MKTVTLLTIGYQGRAINDYMKALSEEKVAVLCDVRKNPISRKPGFSKKSLMTHCQKNSIVYIHLPNLGVDSKHRQNLKNQTDYDKLFKFYIAEILNNVEDDLKAIMDFVKDEKTVALTCFEVDAGVCHRQCIANRLKQSKEVKIKVHNL